ncbi:hypothetical protein [Corynebacterium matruchotii]|uniref:hypothetical protein n=1 Tax=Corynebacterium matruchotii TaxID=43768 RepID=UPI0028E8873C|nr:hypothetical protein [Corynebacterium matruchotii]
MHYRELAANQRGFLLRSQLTEEEIKEARDTGFIINEHLLHTKQGFETQLSESSTSDTYYWLWLLAFPTIPPEQRNPMPYMAGSAALDIRGIGRIVSGDPMYVVTPPELMPYANIEEKVTDEFIVDDNIQPTDWSLVDNTPVENILPALRKYLMTNDDFEYSADATLGAYHHGCSWEELAEVLEVCTRRWTIYETGEKAKTGREVLDQFLNEYASPATSEDEEDDYDYDEDDDW